MNTAERPEMKGRPEKRIQEAGEHTNERESSLGVEGRFTSDEAAEANEDSVSEWLGE